MKLLCIIAAAMALVVASQKAPTYEDRLRIYNELKRQGWFKADKA